MKPRLNSFVVQWGIPLAILIIIVIFLHQFACFFPKWFTSEYFKTFTQNYPEKLACLPKDTVSSSIVLSPSVTGSIGDTFGGTLGPIIAILAAFLTFIAFWIQYRANKIQENYIKQQRFEDTFFRLLDHYKRNVDSMDIREISDPTKIKANGCECFKTMYQDFIKNLKGDKSVGNINLTYDKLQNHFKHDLHHYYRFLYHILKFIKQSEITDTEKLKYSSILRATLSAYELVFIFYNSLHEYGKKNLKPLIEYFSMIKNLDTSLIINIDQKKEFHDLAFSSSNEREKNLKDWQNKNKLK